MQEGTAEIVDKEIKEKDLEIEIFKKQLELARMDAVSRQNFTLVGPVRKCYNGCSGL